MSPLLIAGFHRSGTSAVAQMFHAAGVHLGDTLLGAEPSNPYGHFEDLDVVTLHDTFLESSGHTWKSTQSATESLDEDSKDQLRSLIDQRTRSRRLWGVKDPRLCLFLAEWLSIVPNAHVVVVIRRPDQAIRSLYMRHARRHVDTRGIDPSDLDFWREPDLGLQLWVHYHRLLLRSLTADTSVHFVDFSDRDSVQNIVSTVASRWRLELDTTKVPPLDAGLGQSTVAPVEVRSAELLDEAHAVWNALGNRQARNGLA